MRVSAPARLHFGLIDLSGDLGRVDGGVGVALSLPRTVVVAEEGEELGYSGPRASEVVPKLQELGLKGRVKVLEYIPPHVGLGSTTSLILSAAKALCELNGISLDAEALALLVGRGGTSGVGVAAFERGGFIVDFGHDLDLKGRPLPSSASLTAPPPYMRLEFPHDWVFLVAIPREGPYNEKREIEEFKERTPIPPEESSLVARIVMMLLIPSIVERDINLFKKAINMMQNVGFKKVENEIQEERVKELINKIRDIVGAAGLSSMGPGVYTVVKRKEARVVKSKVERILPKGWRLIVAPPDNKGARLG